MMKSHGYIAAVIVAAAVLAGCSDSDELGSGMPNLNETEEMDLSKLTPQVITQSETYALSGTLGGGLSKFDVNGEGKALVNIKVYPLYAFQGSASSGDYYIVDAEVTLKQAGMYQGTKEGLYSWDTEGHPINIFVEAYYLRQLEFAATLCDKDGNEVAMFPAGYSPSPDTTIGSTTYTYGMDFSLKGTLKVAYNFDTGLITAEARVVPYAYFTNTYTVNLPDVVINNYSTNSAVYYRDKLPFTLADTEFQIPETARTDQTFHMMWIWYVPTTKDTDGEDVGFYLNYETMLTYADCYYTSAIQGFESQENLHELNLGKKSVFITPPSRMPMGYVQINNSSSTDYISGFTVTPKGKDKPVLTTDITRGIAPGESFMCALDIGKYDIQFMHGTDPTAMQTYTYTGDAIVVLKDETVTLDSEYDFWEAATKK